jgi:hypothetical protein
MISEINISHFSTGYCLFNICEATKVLGKVYQAHRLAFLYQEGKFPLEEVDHINHKKDDNRWSNIRHATRVENSKNSGVPDILFPKLEYAYSHICLNILPRHLP